MLNITPATAAAATAQTADAYASQAATRPLAGFGAGAFTREGAWVGSRATEKAAVLALPRIKPVIGASTGCAQAGVGGAAPTTNLVGGAQASGQTGIAQLSIVHVDRIQVDTHNFLQMTRLYPVAPGGVGPHPAREPVPV